LSEVLLTANGIKKYFPIRKGLLQRVSGHVRAVDGVDLDILRGEVIGIVGESGCGKSTIARLVTGLLPPSEGTVKLCGTDVMIKDAAARKRLRRQMSIVFQDPYSSLNPRMNVAALIGEPLVAQRLVNSRKEMDCHAVYLLEKCGMFADQVYRYPHQFSGGQRQRICIARALASNPEFIVFDEAVSALDVSIQAQIINLLMDLRESYELTYMFISHDLDVVRFISDKVVVMYLGQIVESATKEDLFNNPAHPYTKALMAATPTFDKELRKQRVILKGDIPSPSDPPTGCRFHTRCKDAVKHCAAEAPSAKEVSEGHFAYCHYC